MPVNTSPVTTPLLKHILSVLGLLFLLLLLLLGWGGQHDEYLEQLIDPPVSLCTCVRCIHVLLCDTSQSRDDEYLEQLIDPPVSPCTCVRCIHILLCVTPQSRDDEYLEQLIDQQRQDAAFRRQWVTEEVHREKALKRKNRDALIDELVTGLWGLAVFSCLKE